ncbi:MAG: type 4a pilus biogenesis protein PilO [Acidobacteria bacterium]|nr:type 4a pilus biogenesis protein PilO [Acidobacteriota bacterium]MCA1611100.1 type 4a pilus biogenesis protein PilO [Acidobacteriota bacterium]
MAIELKLEERRWWVAALIGAGIGLVLAVAIHYFWFRGINQDIARKTDELKGLQDEINKGRAAERKLSQFREEVKRLELELAKLLQILPSARNTEDLIKRIETLTRQGDFSLKKFTPGEPVGKDFYSEYPIEISLDGTYHNLALFFDRMSRFSRIINVEDMKVGTLETAGAGKSITANFTAKTFIYTGDETAKANAAKPNAATGAAARVQANRNKTQDAAGKIE